MFKSIKIIVIICGIVILSTCSTTKKMWKNHYYNEAIDSFLVTENGEKLVVIGRQYHYIFPVTKDLKAILLSEHRKFIEPSLRNFTVDTNHNIMGQYIFVVLLKDNDAQKRWLESTGFELVKRTADGESRYVYRGMLSGKRYLAGTPIGEGQKFAKSHSLEIEEEASNLVTGAKALATPVTVSIDGVSALLGFKLFVVFAVIVKSLTVIVGPFIDSK